MAEYIPSADHIYLSDEAQELEPAHLAIHADTAERVLGLTGTNFIGQARDTAISAVARQISVQVEIVPELSLLSSRSRGGRSESYRDLDALVAIDPLARQMVDSLFDERDRPRDRNQSRYESVQSIRGRGLSFPYRHGEEGIQP